MASKLYDEKQLEALPVDLLEDLKRRFESNGATARPDYPVLVRVLARKRNPLKDYDALLTARGVSDFLREAAKNQRVVAYKDITDHLGCTPFSRYRWPLRNMLDALFFDCATRGEPILTALVVTQAGLTDDVAKGFADAARRAGISVHDEQRFFEEEKQKVLAAYAG